MNLIDFLIKESWLKTPRIIDAFRKIKRADFLPDDLKDWAESDQALPIVYDQTNSQPLTVAFMLELLEPKEEEKILDIGSGSGWTTALLAEIVGQNGEVIAIDIIPELVEFGKNNIGKYNFLEKGIVKLICADGSKGYEPEAPYDKILVSASAEKLPEAYDEQLKIGGKIVIPIRDSIWLFIKKSDKNFDKFEYPGFVFVPLVNN